MPLFLEKLKLYNFRNYPRYTLICSGKMCIIVGCNAMGKTNIIEAIQLITGIDSFRTGKWEELLKWGEHHGRVEGLMVGDEREINLVMELENGRRGYYLNNKKKRVTQLRGLLPSVLFTPDDLRLIKDEASLRRNAIDKMGIQLSATYSSLKQDYERVIRQRNKILKDTTLNVGLLDSWTESLVLIGSRFYQHRRNLFSKIAKRITSVYGELVPNEHLDAVYIPSWAVSSDDPGKLSVFKEVFDLDEVRDRFSYEVDHVRGREYERKTTLVGPHRDEVSFYINGRDARKYASQGQQRTIVLAWKLAEVMVIEDIGGQPPILLLDDVMSELDASRREALISYTGHRVQTFITATSTSYLSEGLLRSSEIVRL